MACFQIPRMPPPHRPAGLPSAIGSIPPESRGRTLRNSTWQICYADTGEKPKIQSETREMMYSTLRESAAKSAARQVLASPSLHALGKELRSSSIETGFEKSRENAGKVFISESKQKFTKQPVVCDFQSASENLKKKQALMRSRVDLAAGGDKSCSTWQSDLKDSFSANADQKFACQRQQPVDGSILRKSEVTLGRSDTCAYQTETKSQFAAPLLPERAESFASVNGRELRAHSWDHGEPEVKTTSQWCPANQAEMGRKASEKYNCVRPAAFDALGKQLRASSLYLGKDDIDFTVGGHRPQAITRTRSVPGLIGHANY